MDGLIEQWVYITTNIDNYTQDFLIPFTSNVSPLLVTAYITYALPGEMGQHPTVVSNTSFTMMYKHRGSGIKWFAMGY